MRAAYRLSLTGGIAALSLILLLSGCRPGVRSMSADKAFALSASALSGSDRYGLTGVVSIFDPNGVRSGTTRYQGEVTGHGKFNLHRMEGASLVRTRAVAGGSSSFQPLQLLSDVQHHTADVTYADHAYENDTVRLQVKLTDAAANKRIADDLRSELRSLRGDMKKRSLKPAQRKQAEAALDRADRRLNEALSTLKVTTVCLWTADRNTWFPRQMTEDTRLSYQWNGRTYREKRVSETNFLRGGGNDTIR
jgi:hypothetical protein